MAHKIFFNYRRTKVGKPSRFHLKQVIQVNITYSETNGSPVPLVMIHFEGQACK